MTLIAAVLTPEFAILAADPRLTYKRRRDGQTRVTRRDDSENKTIIVDDHWVMGFAGLARVNWGSDDAEAAGDGEIFMQRMEGWLSDECEEMGEGEDYFDRIAARFGPAAEAQKLLSLHEFVAVGFDPANGLEPTIVRVANSDPLFHTFYVIREPLGDRDFAVATAPRNALSPDQSRWLTKAVKRSLANAPKNPHRLHDVLANLVAQVAAQTDDVGPSAMVTSFPRAALPLEGGIVSLEVPFPQKFAEWEVSQRFDPNTGGVTLRGIMYPARLTRRFHLTGFQFDGGGKELKPLDSIRRPEVKNPSNSDHS